MITLSLHNILEYLRQKKFHAELQTETQQVVILFKIAEREFPLFIRIFEGGELVQLLAFLPCNIKENAMADTARLLHLLNKELDLPGFGMDEFSAVVFYRCMIPVQHKKLEETILEAFLNSIQTICKSFAPIVAAVAYGGVSYEEIQKKLRDQGGDQNLSQSQLRS